MTRLGFGYDALPALLLLSLLVAAHAAVTPYHVTTDLGSANDDAAAGNPLKGFLTNPDWSSPPYLESVPSSLEFYYVGLNKVMTGFNQFDWDTYLEPRLDGTASRNKHAIVRFLLDTPGEPTYVPQFLIDGGLAFNSYSTYGGGQSPDYNDADLLLALQQFIAAFGERYDGDSRLGFVQVGLLGFWGEWHTYTDGSGTTEGWIPDTTKDAVVAWFDDAFHVTPLQVRYPYPAANDVGFGLHDDSFAHSTLDGSANGGEEVDWFFWPSVVSSGYTDFWRTGVMGGEVRPELQSSIFASTYPAGTAYHQDLNLCVEVTHATYSLNYHAFAGTGYDDGGGDLDRARAANHRMGYAFRVTKVEASRGALSSHVDVAVTVEQTGVAPFYYPLALTLDCPGGTSVALPGVETIVDEGDSLAFTFTEIPATSECLDQLNIGLSSSYVYTGNPVKFAQGTDGTFVSLSVPLPPATTPAPVGTTASPVTPNPTPSQTQAPTRPPTQAPTSSPVAGNGCTAPCTDADDCKGDGSTGAQNGCGTITCDTQTGLCSYNAWVGSCPLFLECSGDDSICTNGPLGSVGTCTGYNNNECIYEYCPVVVSPTRAPVTPSPTAAPVVAVTPSPTSGPTSEPTGAPSLRPTSSPVTSSPTTAPVTASPTQAPVTSSPTMSPVTPSPTQSPTQDPTRHPTHAPTSSPVAVTPSPTTAPTSEPTDPPSQRPTVAPTMAPITAPPTQAPATSSPTTSPVTPSPTRSPTQAPTAPPTQAPASSPVTGNGCTSPCTDAEDCKGDGSTGAQNGCGEITCDSQTGLCSFNAWVESSSCPLFLECYGDDGICTNGPLGSVGTCTGYNNNECIYEYCPVVVSPTPAPVQMPPSSCQSSSECNDGILCTTDECHGDQQCHYTPDDSLCSTFCSESQGCTNPLSFDDFEGGWGSFTRSDGSQSGCQDSCRRSDSGKARGVWSLRIRDDSGAASSIYSNDIDAAAFGMLKVDFWFYPDSMDDESEDFFLEYSTNLTDDNSWVYIQSWAKGIDFENGSWYNPSVYYDISQINEPFKIRFRCDASANGDKIFIDDVTISAD